MNRSIFTETKTLINSGYLKGVFWIIMVALTSNLNDILMRFLGSNLPASQIVFLRFLFASLTLLPVMLYYGRSAFHTQRLGFHLIRSVILVGAFACWATGLKTVPLVVVSTLGLTTQLFVLPLAAIFLKEKIGWQRTLATLVGFTGVCVMIWGESSNSSVLHSLNFSENGIAFLLSATLLFATSDILNKKYIAKESTLAMMFYIALGTTLFSSIPAWMVWQMPNPQQFGTLILLGASANFILLFLIKAFAATDVSALAPFRYTELFVAGITGFIIFHEIPSAMMLIGSAIIIISTSCVAYYEIHTKPR